MNELTQTKTHKRVSFCKDNDEHFVSVMEFLHEILDYKLQIYNLKVPDDDPNTGSKLVGLVHRDCIV